MKRYKDIFNQIWDYQNLKTAHLNARRGKGWYREVKAVNDEPFMNEFYEVNIKSKGGKAHGIC